MMIGIFPVNSNVFEEEGKFDARVEGRKEASTANVMMMQDG